MEYHGGVTRHNQDVLEKIVTKRNFDVKTEKSDPFFTIIFNFQYACNKLWGVE